MSGRRISAAATRAWLARRFGPRAGEVAAAYRQTLGRDSPRGRLILADLATLCGAGRTSFVPGDALETAFNEGKRAVFLHIAAILALTAADLAAAESADE